MKRLSASGKERIVRIARLRLASRLRRRGAGYILHRETIGAPAVLSFKDNFLGTVGFLEKMRGATLHEGTGRRVHIDLAPIRYLSVPVAIVLAAEFHRWSIVRHLRLRALQPERWDPMVRNLLSHLGVFELLEVRNRPHWSRGHDHVTLSPLQSGLRFDGRKIDQLQSRFNIVLQGFTKNPEVYAGMTEAAENAVVHAYPADFVPRHRFAGHRWWGASCLDLSNKSLRFFIFDQGAGIPFTLPTIGWYENIRAFAASLNVAPNDTVMLRAALEVARTRTGQANRGLGLARMAEVIQGSVTGYLRIISGRGEIICHPDGTIESRHHDTDIGGTLIEWSLPADVFTAE